MKFFTRRHGSIALLAACLSTSAFSQAAKWTLYEENNYYEVGAGYFEGPGVAEAYFYTCAIKMTLLANERLSVKPSHASIRIHYTYSDKGYAANYGLSCYTGERLKKIKAEFTAPDGSLGLSTSDLERRQEYPEANTSAVYLNGKNWQGVGITEDIRNIEHPLQNINFCLFGEHQALCAFTSGKYLDDPNDKEMEILLDQLGRIEFIDPDK